MNSKYLAELIVELCNDDLERALDKANDIQNQIILMLEEKQREDILNSELVQSVKRVSYSECLEMFKDYGVEFFEADTWTKFEENLWETTYNGEYDCYQLNTETEVYWNFNAVEEFIERIKENTERNDGLCDLVMLPNNSLQEIPLEFAYRLED